MSPALRIAAVLAAASLTISGVGLATLEGRPQKGYLDLGNLPTGCWGHTGPDVRIGVTYSDDQCMTWLAQDVVRHGVEIDRCISVDVPAESRAAFISFAYNVGSAAFCGSTLAKRLNAGDLAGACSELSRWVRVKGITVQGLINRRRVERAWCEKGLHS